MSYSVTKSIKEVLEWKLFQGLVSKKKVVDRQKQPVTPLVGDRLLLSATKMWVSNGTKGYVFENAECIHKSETIDMDIYPTAFYLLVNIE